MSRAGTTGNSEARPPTDDKKNILSLQFLRANGESGTGGDGHEGKSVARDVPSPPPVPSPLRHSSLVP